MKKVDYLIQVIYILIILLLSIFLGYKYDILITVLGVLIATTSGAATFYQYKKIKELGHVTDTDKQH